MPVPLSAPVSANVTARRSFLATLLGACAVHAQTVSGSGSQRNFPPAAVRYSDPATEFTVVRLTDSQYSSHLGVGNRNITARGMLFASDLSGTWQAYWMDLKKRSFRLVSDATGLDIDSLSLLPNERGFFYFDDAGLHEADLGNVKKVREIYRVPNGFSKARGVAFNDAGTHAAFMESSEGACRLRLLDLARSTASTLFASPNTIDSILFRPRHDSLLYRQMDEVMTVNFDGSQSRKTTLAEGQNLQFEWTGDGSSLLYLNRPLDSSKLTGLREWTLETGADALIANTSQFVRFHANANASVFIGASGSKASPYILLLIRTGKRELTLAEHHASDASMTAPQFSPNSQAIFFMSDRHGKPAIYWMPVDKLVSETDGS